MITTKTLRQPEWDGLRGVAALVVASTHYLGAFFPYAVFGDRFVHSPKFDWEAFFFLPPFGLATAGSFAVCLFFVLSGYVLSQGHLGQGRDLALIFSALIKRPVRLGGIVLFTVLLGGICWWCGWYSNKLVADVTRCNEWFGSFWPGEFDRQEFWSAVLTSLFGGAGRYNPPLWTIKIELYGSVYVYLFLLFFGGAKFRWLFVLLLLFFLRNSPYFGFFLGVAMADLQHRSWVLGPKASSWLGCGLFLGFLYFSSYPAYVSDGFLESSAYGSLPFRAPLFVGYPMLAAAMLFASVILLYPLRRILSLPILTWVGNISYAFYALHFLVLGTVVGWLFLVFVEKMNYLVACSLASALGMLLTLGLAQLTMTMVDRPACRGANWFADQVLKCLRILRKRFCQTHS